MALKLLQQLGINEPHFTESGSITCCIEIKPVMSTAVVCCSQSRSASENIQ